MSQELIRVETLTSPELWLALDLVRASPVISRSISARTLGRSYAVDGRLLLPVEYLRLGLFGGTRLSTSDVLKLVSLSGKSASLWMAD